MLPQGRSPVIITIIAIITIITVITIIITIIIVITMIIAVIIISSIIITVALQKSHSPKSQQLRPYYIILQSRL